MFETCFDDGVAVVSVETGSVIWVVVAVVVVVEADDGCVHSLALHCCDDDCLGLWLQLLHR